MILGTFEKTHYIGVGGVVGGATLAVSSFLVNHGPLSDYGFISGIVIAACGSVSYSNDIIDFLQRNETAKLPPLEPKYWGNP